MKEMLEVEVVIRCTVRLPYNEHGAASARTVLRSVLPQDGNSLLCGKPPKYSLLLEQQMATESPRQILTSDSAYVTEVIVSRGETDA